MMKNKYLLFTAFFSLITIVLSAQDKHFTQFYAAPQTLNPALTGAFSGKYRFNANYRNQWSGVLESPFLTYSAQTDIRFPVSKNPSNADAVGVGVTFYSDRVNYFNYNTNQVLIAGAYHKALADDGNQFLTLGFQGGLGQKNISYGNLTFQDQFNGQDGFDFATGEAFPENNFSYPDLNVGLNYSLRLKNTTAIFLGGAIHHIFTPNISFYNQNDASAATTLLRKYSVQMSSQIPLRKSMQISPRFLMALQGNHAEINAGTNLRFELGDDENAALQVGAWVRPVRSAYNKVNLDAAVFLLGIEYNRFLIGASYDFNLRGLSAYGVGQGAFEISISYLGEYDNDSLLCPKF